MSTRVLVADDAGFVREALRKWIEPAGYEIVAEAADGIEAIRKFSRSRPELVLLDTLMPRCTGLDALRIIRSLRRDARVVMCSARGQEVLVMQALQAGALDYVVKPLCERCLLETLRKTCATRPPV